MKNSVYKYLIPTIGGCLLLSCNQKNKEQNEQQPNFLLILADDMGYSDIGCYGSEISTPNLDSLAAEGMRMTQFYNASRSCPTRASLLTGLYQHQAGVGDMTKDYGIPQYQGHLNKKCVTLAEVLKKAGYNTYMSGKWHVGDQKEHWPVKRGFDKYFGLIQGASSYYNNDQYRNNKNTDHIIMAENDKEYFPPGKNFYMTDAFSDKAIEYLKEQESKSNPFFLYLAYTAPHWPLHALPEDIAKYKGKYMKGWDQLRKKRYSKLREMGLIKDSCHLSPRFDEIPPWDQLSESEKEEWDLKMAVYAAMIDRMDQGIGKVINQLKKMGEYDNTLVIFLSDNGGCHEDLDKWSSIIDKGGEIGSKNSFTSYAENWANVSNTPFRLFKSWSHEGGISTPFIARYPKMIKPNSICNVPLHIINIMPTFVEMANAEYPDSANNHAVLPMEGESMVPYFKGKNDYGEEHLALYWEHHGNRAVRKGDWKIVSKWDWKNNKYGPWELYYISNDRAEINDLSNKHPNTVKLLEKWYYKWANRIGVVDRNTILNIRSKMKNK